MGGNANVPCTCTHAGCYANERVGWAGMITSLALAHMLDAAQVMGWGGGGDKYLHIERKITSVVHSHPPSHYIRKHAPG